MDPYKLKYIMNPLQPRDATPIHSNSSYYLYLQFKKEEEEKTVSFPTVQETLHESCVG